MSIKNPSIYKICQDCKKHFIITGVVATHEKLYGNPIFCPKCNSNNICNVTKEYYYE